MYIYIWGEASKNKNASKNYKCIKKTINASKKINDHEERREGGKEEGGKEGRKEGGKDGRKEGRREGGKEGRRKGGKEGRREGGKEGRKEGRQAGRQADRQAGRKEGSTMCAVNTCSLQPPRAACKVLLSC